MSCRQKLFYTELVSHSRPHPIPQENGTGNGVWPRETNSHTYLLSVQWRYLVLATLETVNAKISSTRLHFSKHLLLIHEPAQRHVLGCVTVAHLCTCVNLVLERAGLERVRAWYDLSTFSGADSPQWTPVVWICTEGGFPEGGWIASCFFWHCWLSLPVSRSSPYARCWLSSWTVKVGSSVF